MRRWLGVLGLIVSCGTPLERTKAKKSESPKNHGEFALQERVDLDWDEIDYGDARGIYLKGSDLAGADYNLKVPQVELDGARIVAENQLELVTHELKGDVTSEIEARDLTLQVYNLANFAGILRCRGRCVLRTTKVPAGLRIEGSFRLETTD